MRIGETRCAFDCASAREQPDCLPGERCLPELDVEVCQIFQRHVVAGIAVRVVPLGLLAPRLVLEPYRPRGLAIRRGRGPRGAWAGSVELEGQRTWPAPMFVGAQSVWNIS